MIKMLRYLAVGMQNLLKPARAWAGPLHLQVEVTTFCNLDCVMCSHGTMITHPKHMELADFVRICELLKPYKISMNGIGEPFLPRDPKVYARMLGEKMRRHEVNCWLVNTGWVGGAYGTGERIALPYTRVMVNAAIEGGLRDVPAAPHPVFQVMAPKHCPGVPDGLLDPRGQWKDGAEYDRAAKALAARFQRNFEKFGAVEADIVAASPA